MTLGSQEARPPHEVITRGRQRVGVPQMARPCTAGREDGGGPQAKKRQELGVLGAWGRPVPPTSGRSELLQQQQEANRGFCGQC